jgi:transposase
VVADRKSPQDHVWRARIVLMTADGAGTMAIHTATGKGKPTIWRWQARYMQDGADGLFWDAPRGRAFAAASPERAAAVVERTWHEEPLAATHLTLRLMANASDLAPSTIHRIWREHGLKPHWVETFKFSNDPKFVEKVRDIVGLDVNAPERALVLSVDQKNQIQALDRTQPGLPMKRGRGVTMTKDYKCHGTITLFAALDLKAGTVIGRCMQRHRHQEFIRFLSAVEAEVPAGKVVRAILDNYAADKHQGHAVAGPAPALRLPLHADLSVVAQACMARRQGSVMRRWVLGLGGGAEVVGPMRLGAADADQGLDVPRFEGGDSFG